MPTSFSDAEGWNIVQASVGPESWDLPVTWASNVPFEPETGFSGFPDNTVRRLPPSGIVFAAVGPRSYSGSLVFPPFSQPLELYGGLSNFDQYEGQPSRTVSAFLIDAQVGDELLNIVAWLGTNTPTPEMVAEANNMLAGLVVT